MSSESTPVLSGAVPVFQGMVTQWKKLAATAPHCAPFIESGLRAAMKYTGRMDNTMAYAVAMCQFHLI
jgi:hypothetical protein